MSSNYQNYFIKNGRHIGRYEDMYQNCDDPWHIEKLGQRLDMKAALLLLEGHEPAINRFLDIGAGLGLFTQLLAKAIWAQNPSCQGVVTDISATALKGAQARLNDERLSFKTLNANNPETFKCWPLGFFDLVLMAQVLWGVLETLPQTLLAINNLMPAHGLLLISQHFPKAEQQSYGAEIVASPQDFIAYLENSGFVLMDTLETNRLSNHHWAAILKKDNPLAA
ncbi:MAG: class I SAM-dependent methyltransferase [Candidatus Adiutrix sp.]